VNRLQHAGSLGQYISISIKDSSMTYFIEIWSHDRHLIIWRHTCTCLRLGHGSIVRSTVSFGTDSCSAFLPWIISHNYLFFT